MADTAVAAAEVAESVASKDLDPEAAPSGIRGGKATSVTIDGTELRDVDEIDSKPFTMYKLVATNEDVKPAATWSVCVCVCMCVCACVRACVRVCAIDVTALIITTP